MGGKECDISSDLFEALALNTGRWLTRASQRINTKKITETTEIIEPTLATEFQS